MGSKNVIIDISQNAAHASQKGNQEKGGSQVSYYSGSDQDTPQNDVIRNLLVIDEQDSENERSNIQKDEAISEGVSYENGGDFSAKTLP